MIQYTNQWNSGDNMIWSCLFIRGGGVCCGVWGGGGGGGTDHGWHYETSD